MTEDVKICPECNAEYLPHIEECASCEVGLVRPGESAPKVVEEGLGDVTKHPLIEGDMARIVEVVGAVEAAGIPYEISKYARPEDSAPGGCAPKERYALLVPRAEAEKALRAIEEFHRTNPETEEARERMEQGCCPACGTVLMRELKECPDCGLNVQGPGDERGGHGEGCC